MYAVGRLSSYISTVSGPFHPFGGAVDIIVVQQPDGSFKSSPWYVKFGKFQGVLKTKEKVVNISVNGVEAGFHMYLNHKGEAYFLKELDGEEEDSVFSPPSSCDETDHPSRSERITKFKSFDVDIDANQSSQATRIDVSNGKIVSRTNSRRSRIFGLVFGRKSMKEDGIGAERVTSLERAELAADLLEVKWSTNLPTSKPGTMPVKEADKDLQIDDEQSLGSRLVPDSIGNSYDLPVIHVESDLCDNSGSDFGNTESSDKEIMEKVPCLGTQEQVMEISASDEEDRREVIYEVCSVSEITVTDLSNPDIVELEVGCSTQSGTETDVILSSSGNERDCSYIYRETAEISRVRTDDSFEQAIETMDFYHGGCEEVQPHGEVLYQTAELISEVNPQPESEVLATIENLNGTGYPRNGDSSDFLVTKTISESEGTSVNSATSIVKESLLSLDLQFVTSNSVTTEMLEVNHQDTLTEYLAQNKILETEPVEVFENQSQITDFSYSHISEGNKVSIGQPSKALVSHIQVVGVDQILGSVEEGELPSISTASHLSNSVHRVQEEENLGKENKMNKLCPSQEFLCDPQESGFDSLSVKAIKTNVSTSESLEEDQFLFSDIDDLVPSRVQCKDSICLESRETENHGSLTLEGIEDEHERGNVDPESSSFQDKLIEEYPASDFEGFVEESGVQSTPLIIPRIHKGAGEVRLIESLPNLWSHIDILEASDAPHPLSQSLDSNSGNLKLGPHRKDVSSSLKSDANSEHHLMQEHPRVEDTQTSRELKSFLTNNAVEISLCKHLLYEGMGADAASQAFDAEKVDLEKFSSLGHALVKNDSLIVKIGGRYFPWDAAAPSILGMAAFGHEQIFVPEGMIAIDQVEKAIEGDPSRAIVATGGSWRLWPFTFRRARSRNYVQKALNGTKDSDAENASDNISDTVRDENVPKAKVTKRKERLKIPTSEQLASLNLKEGQNVITFTFSTAMLGKQQEEARIYLWKWNTHIVVSDVDGTITKSDVLGQFMPLVGKDWSQTGVAHLFSAIKENGYQFLFLSARAISQAYLTRQFLLNLKQDGKALPDGPVVISPDGLVPSLFREVIRRAPHEFKIACLEVTCRLLGVILEESSPEELQKQATVRSSVLEVLLEITKSFDLYLMERILNDESGEKVLLALENAGIFTSGGLVKDKVLFCSTENGRTSFVRQLEPDWHIDTNPEIIFQLARFIKYQLHICPNRPERTAANVFSSPTLEHFFGFGDRN